MADSWTRARNRITHEYLVVPESNVQIYTHTMMGACQRDILATNLIPVAKAERILSNKIVYYWIISHSTNIHESILIQMNKQMWRKRQIFLIKQLQII